MERKIYACLVQILLCALSWYAFTVHARDWQVIPDGVSLDRIIKVATSGDRLHIASGTYRVNLTLNKRLELLGQPGAILDGGGQGNVLRIAVSGVLVRNLQLRDSGRNLTDMNSVIFVERGANGVHILNNNIQSSAFGIWVDRARDVRIVGNRIQGNNRIRSQDRGNGIHLFNASGALVENNEVWHTRDGIYIDTSNHNILRGNFLHDLRYGIHYMYSYHNQVVNNRTKHTRTGYALMQSKYLTVTGNRSEEDQNYGILMNYIVYSRISNNRIVGVRPGTSRILGGEAVTGAEGKGVFVYNCQFNQIHTNIIANSDIGIHLTAGSEDNRIFDNGFVANRTQVKYVATRSQEWSRNGRGNYWSDYLGWDLNADGIGDRPYEPIDGVDRLLWKYPLARVLMHSPAVDTLHWVQGQFPVLRPQGVRDSHPLMAVPTPLRGRM